MNANLSAIAVKIYGTLDDTVEFFNLVLGTKLTPTEKQDLLQFLRAL